MDNNDNDENEMKTTIAMEMMLLVMVMVMVMAAVGRFGSQHAGELADVFLPRVAVVAMVPAAGILQVLRRAIGLPEMRGQELAALGMSCHGPAHGNREGFCGLHQLRRVGQRTGGAGVRARGDVLSADICPHSEHRLEPSGNVARRPDPIR